MIDELMDLKEIAALYRCGYRHARDVITKLPGYPEKATGSSSKTHLWLKCEVRAFLHSKSQNMQRFPPQIPHSQAFL